MTQLIRNISEANCERKISSVQAPFHSKNLAKSESNIASRSQTISLEFEQILSVSSNVDLKSSASVGLLPENLSKNRYNDIIPFDFNRVRLHKGATKTPNENIASYINGSHIQLSHDIPMIAAQGPTAKTAGSFFQMLWEQNVTIIVCAVNETENEQSKCAKYWPSNRMEEYRTKHYTVQLAREPVEMHSQGNYIIRYLKLICTYSNQFRHIWHYHFIQWPDHGVPDNLNSVCDLIFSMKRRNSNAPILVHCSAGCGRTGTVIGLSKCTNVIFNGNAKDVKSLSIFKIVYNLRHQRIGMVQTLAQYRFMYQVLIQLINHYLYNHSNRKVQSWRNSSLRMLTPHNAKKCDREFTSTTRTIDQLGYSVYRQIPIATTPSFSFRENKDGQQNNDNKISNKLKNHLLRHFNNLTTEINNFNRHL
ncbi:hypothetical protein GJ496_003710 [Pomphorhynchus laevis]|nr:hypothetical protein GJ496_003710 [Pomphorhynchus laevis]